MDRNFDENKNVSNLAYSPLLDSEFHMPIAASRTPSVVKTDSYKSANVHVTNSAALTIFLLINTMIGSGILNQPAVFKDSGILGGILGYILATYMTWLGLNLLTVAGLKVNIYEYGELAKRALGRKGEILVDVSIVVGAFGSILGYILVVGSTVSDLLQTWSCTNQICGFYWTTCLSVTFLVLPACLLRHFGHLAWISIFSVFAIACVLLLVIIGGPIERVPGPTNVINGLGLTKSLGSIAFSLACAHANFQAYITTTESAQNRKSWMEVTGITVVIGSLMCIFMGIAGYLSFKDSTDGIILDNFKGHQFDFFKIMVAVHLIFYIPVDFVIMRYSFSKLVFNKKSEDLIFTTHATITAGLLGGMTAFVCLLNVIGLTSGQSFSLILGLTGGIAVSFRSFILPGWIFIAVCDSSDSLYYPAHFTLWTGILIMFAVVSIIILENTGVL